MKILLTINDDHGALCKEIIIPDKYKSSTSYELIKLIEQKLLDN